MSPVEAIMMRNGLYSMNGKFMDGIEGDDNGVLVLHDGTMRGAIRFFTFSAVIAAQMANGEVK